MDTLAGMRVQGVPLAEIALQMDRTLRSIQQRTCLMAKGYTVLATRRGGLPFSKAEDEKLLLLVEAGEPWQVATSLVRDLLHLISRRENIAKEMPKRRRQNLRVRHATLMHRNGDDRGMDYAKYPWTAEEDRLLLDLFAQGLSPAGVAQKLGRSERAIYSRRSKINPGFRRILHPWNREEEQIISNMRAEGISWREVALKLGPHRSEAGAGKYYNSVMKRRDARPLITRQSAMSSGKSCPRLLTTTLASIGGKREGSTEVRRYTPRIVKSWTQEDLNSLARMRKEGHSRKEISAKLQRTISSVSTKAWEQSKGAKPPLRRRFTEAEDEKLMRLYDLHPSWY